MTEPKANGCDDTRLYRYLDGELEGDEQARMVVHLEACRSCRRHLAALPAFAETFRDRVRQATGDVDFTALEKAVLNKALRQRHAPGGTARLFTALKFVIPAAVTAGLLLFFGYSNDVVHPPTAPSAIINSFTGSMSSVMIFETPETRQTILWYTEDTDVESEPNAV